MCNQREFGDSQLVFYLDEIWVNQNDTDLSELHKKLEAEGSCRVPYPRASGSLKSTHITIMMK
jgi:hypothetical protein